MKNIVVCLGLIALFDKVENAYTRGFQPVGHSGIFSGPQSINQNESNVYNEVIMVKKIENEFPARIFFYVFAIKIEKLQTNSK